MLLQAGLLLYQLKKITLGENNVLTFQSWTSFSITPTKSCFGFPDGVLHCNLGTEDLWSRWIEEDREGLFGFATRLLDGYVPDMGTYSD